MDAVLETPAPPAPEATECGGKYLTFLLDGVDYGINVLQIREIIGVLDITAVPQTADFVRGIINLRGKVIPVIDLRIKLGMQPKAHDEETCIIVVDVGQLMGILVDTVREVFDINKRQIDPAPRIGGKHDTGFILGMGKIGDDVKLLLDINKVTSTDPFVIGANPP